MDFQDVVRRRRMVRSFDGRPVAADVVERIVGSGLRGPSAGFTQATELLVLQGVEETERYWAATFGPGRRESFRWPGLFRAPLLVVVLSNPEAYVARYGEPDKGRSRAEVEAWPVPYWHVDAGFAALLVAMTAVDAGLGALFFGVFEVDAFRTAFGVPDDYTPVGAVAVGHRAPDDEPSGSLARGRRPRDELVHRGRW